jgi:hypothetical protein
MFWKGKRTQLQDDNIVLMSTDGELWANVPLYLDEVNHSPTGFEWGYYGSGPSQLAYAILRSYFELEDKLDIPTAISQAKRHYMRFKGEFVAKFGEEWELTSAWLEVWLTGERVGWVGDERDGWV